MTNDNALWKILQRYIPRKKWMALTEIFLIVQGRTRLDTEDLERTKRSGKPHWKSNVSRILRSKQRDGSIRVRKHQTDEHLPQL
jgi:hypothetical protein